MKQFTLVAIGVMMLVSLLTPLSLVRAVDCPQNSSSPTENEDICNPSKFYVDLGDTKNNFQGLIMFIIQALIGIAGLLSIAFIILGGFSYITSRGNEEQAETGKKTLTNAIIGLVLVIFSYIIVVVVTNALYGRTGA